MLPPLALNPPAVPGLITRSIPSLFAKSKTVSAAGTVPTEFTLNLGSIPELQRYTSFE